MATIQPIRDDFGDECFSCSGPATQLAIAKGGDDDEVIVPACDAHIDDAVTRADSKLADVLRCEVIG